MNVRDHLDLISAHAYSLHKEFKDHPERKNAEISSLLWNILDSVLSIENYLPPKPDTKRFP